MNKPLEVKRWVRSLISTCAASVLVTCNRRQSVGDFINYALNNVPRIWNGFKGGKLVYFNDSCALESEIVNPNVSDALNGLDYLNFDEHLTDKTLEYVAFVSGKWFSVPDHELKYDLTNRDDALREILIGNALALLPWLPDNTFELKMHGTQLLPGVYQIRIREMFIFDKMQYGAQGAFNAIGAIVTYHLTISEGKFSGHRKSGGRRPFNMKVENQHNIDRATKVEKKKKDRGLSL